MPVFEIKPLSELQDWMLKLESDGDYQWMGESLSKKSRYHYQRNDLPGSAGVPACSLPTQVIIGNGAGADTCDPGTVGFGLELSRRPSTNHAPDPQSEDRSQQRQDESAWMKSGTCAPDETTHHASND